MVVLEVSLIDLLFLVIICDSTWTMLHVVLELSFVSRVTHLKCSSSALLAVFVVALIVVTVGSGQPSSSIEEIILDATLIRCSA